MLSVSEKMRHKYVPLLLLIIFVVISAEEGNQANTEEQHSKKAPSSSTSEEDTQDEDHSPPPSEYKNNGDYDGSIFDNVLHIIPPPDLSQSDEGKSKWIQDRPSDIDSSEENGDAAAKLRIRSRWLKSVISEVEYQDFQDDWENEEVVEPEPKVPAEIMRELSAEEQQGRFTLKPLLGPSRCLTSLA